MRKLKIGDSVLLPETQNARRLAWQAANRCGIRVRVRRTTKGLRCWRIESVLTLEKLCDGLQITTKDARARLRRAVARKELDHMYRTRWEWPKGSPEIKKVRALLKP